MQTLSTNVHYEGTREMNSKKRASAGRLDCFADTKKM